MTEWKSEINENGEEVPVPLITYPCTKKGTGIAGAVAVAGADPGAAGWKRPSGSGVGVCPNYPMGYDTVRYGTLKFMELGYHSVGSADVIPR